VLAVPPAGHAGGPPIEGEVTDAAFADACVLDGIGHCPQLDVPLEAAQLILGFTA
jgi:hypothetical protein